MGPSSLGVTSTSLSNPYPGLRPFELEQADRFFGRDDDVFSLLDRLQRSRFLAVLGVSGCGKSSLVKAGLLAALQDGFLVERTDGWHIATFRPGHSPIANLARALAQAGRPPVTAGTAEPEEDFFRAALRQSPAGLVQAARMTGLSAGGKLLILVDQFEELFRFMLGGRGAGAASEARSFIALLLKAIGQDDVPIYLVLTMRSEYLGNCAPFQELTDAINDSSYLVPYMTRDQLREAIEKPALLFDRPIAPSLVNRLLNDANDGQDQLPVLQHALMRLWSIRQRILKDGPIDLDDYARIGTLRSALSEHANEALEQLGTPRFREIAEQVFRSLITLDQWQPVRRPLRLSQLYKLVKATEEEVRWVINHFRTDDRCFLIPPGDVPLTDETFIDISHESLIRQWDRLRKWAEAESVLAIVRERLRHCAMLWYTKSRDPTYLDRGPILAEAESWAKAHPEELEPVTRQFLEESRRREGTLPGRSASLPRREPLLLQFFEEGRKMEQARPEALSIKIVKADVDRLQADIATETVVNRPTTRSRNA